MRVQKRLAAFSIRLLCVDAESGAHRVQLSHRSRTFNIHRLREWPAGHSADMDNCVRFDETWAAGLSNLLKLLEREGAPKSSSAGPGCVAEWYRRSIDQNRQIVVSRERCYSNWFPLTLPKEIRFHQFKGPADSLIGMAAALSFPYKAHGEFLITFAPLLAVEEAIGPHFSGTKICDSAAFIEGGSVDLGIQRFDASNIVSDLVRQAWDLAMGSRDFSFHAMANGQKAWFFKNSKLDKNRGYYELPSGKRAYRQLVGHKTRKKLDGSRVPDGFWHYAASASPNLLSFPRLVLKHHVIFTDDGETPWSAAERMHKARRPEGRSDALRASRAAPRPSLWCNRNAWRSQAVRSLDRENTKGHPVRRKCLQLRYVSRLRGGLQNTFARKSPRPACRRLALHMDDRNAFLWTMGYVPKLATYPGREVPTPLKIKIVFGETKLDQVLADILALTKLNFNACIFGDGLPVTLRFADDIGEILTAIPEVGSKPLPFRHYI
jgi:hypothetical protein